MSRRDDFVEVLLSWEGERWAKVGTRRGGVNCLGLLVGAARELGGLEGLVDIAAPYANFVRPPVYGEMLRRMKEYLTVVLPLSDAVPGDLLLFRADGEPQHVSVIVAPGTIIHSLRSIKRVRVELIPPGWAVTVAFRIEELG